MRFETDRLILKDVTDEDIPCYQKYFVDYAVISQLSSVVPWPYPAGGVSDFLHSSVFDGYGVECWHWGIFLKESPRELIGSVGLWRKGKPENRGFWLGRPFWGRGIMTEAVRPLLDYSFEELGFEKLILSNAAGNERSRRIKEKTGATFIGLRSAKFVNRDYNQAETWELTKEAWIQFRAEAGRKLCE